MSHVQASYTDGTGKPWVIRGEERDGEVFWEQPVDWPKSISGEFIVGPDDGPAVPEPRPFDCPVCELVGFDCGAH